MRKAKRQEPAGAEMGRLAEKFEALAYQIVDALDDKVEKASLRDAVAAAGSAIEQAQQLRGDTPPLSPARLDLSRLSDGQLEELYGLLKIAALEA